MGVYSMTSGLDPVLFCEIFEVARRVRGRWEEMLVARDIGSGEIVGESDVEQLERSRHRSSVLAILFGANGCDRYSI